MGDESDDEGEGVGESTGRVKWDVELRELEEEVEAGGGGAVGEAETVGVVDDGEGGEDAESTADWWVWVSW